MKRHRTTIGSLFAVMLAASAEVAAEEHGKTLYTQYCLACHGADGAGTMPGVPDLTDKAGVLAKPNALLLRSLLDGVQRPGAPVAMPPKGGNPALTEEDMQAVLAYIRHKFDSDKREGNLIPRAPARGDATINRRSACV